MDTFIKTECDRCVDGVTWRDNGVGGNVCQHCDGTGWLAVGRVLGAGVYWSHQVVDVTNIPEYSALSDNNKATFNLIVSCGQVNLNDGAVKTWLWSVFDSESTTRANYITLIG